MQSDCNGITKMPPARQRDYEASNAELALPDTFLPAKRGEAYSAQAGFYSNVDPNVSVRPPYNRGVYEYFRRNEKIPDSLTQEDYRQIMIMCQAAYDRVGIIRSVIDMMSEFAAEGIEIIHADKEPNNFYKAWSKRVNLEDRTERFLNSLYKSGAVVVRRKFGNVDNDDVRKMKRANAALNLPEIEPGRIPLEYLFYNPATIELVGGTLASLSEQKVYALRVPLRNLDGLKTPKTDLEKRVYNNLPQEVKDAFAGKTTAGQLFLIPLDKDKIFVGNYKKDDTEMWGKSFIYSILDDIMYNDKLKLAKISALDGWYNVIRLWKLGDHTVTPAIYPDRNMSAKLAGILQHNTGGGAMDLIWRSDIDMTEYYPPVEKLVNFQENTHNILLGLGVPESLVGGSGSKTSNSSNNYLGMKNLIKRLEAGRRLVKEWLEGEIDIIQKNMGFRKRPIIRFANSDLFDEKTYLNLLIQLADRNIVSDETVLERINESPEIEEVRIKNEKALRDGGTKPKKASPYHKPELEQQQNHEINKIKVQTRESAKVAASEGNNSSNMVKSKPKIRSKGRPSGSKDKGSRTRSPNKKTRTTMGALMVESAKIYDFVDQYLRSKALDAYQVTNIRQLTAKQEAELDEAKALLFPLIEPFGELSEEVIGEALAERIGPVEEFQSAYAENLSDLSTDKVSNDQKRMLRITAYVQAWTENGV